MLWATKREAIGNFCMIIAKGLAWPVELQEYLVGNLVDAYCQNYSCLHVNVLQD